jgi:chromosome segregation ATPase
MTDHADVLTPETVAQLRDAGPKDLVWLLCDSHELIRGERDEARRERDAAKSERQAYAQAGLDQLDRHRAELDIVIRTRKEYVEGWKARAEAAEAERDEARREFDKAITRNFDLIERATAAEAEVARLRGALEEIAILADAYDAVERDEQYDFVEAHWRATEVARSALASGSEGGHHD